MTQTQKTETTENSESQARAQLESIKEMVTALDTEDGIEYEEAEQRILEDALSVECRSGWYAAGSLDNAAPEEYRILLCTGGPAVQIVGELSKHNEPKTARLQHQDWFTPWQDLKISTEDQEALLTYARCFYYGEG